MSRIDWAERRERVASSLRDSGRTESVGWRALCPFCVSSKTNRADYSLKVKRSGWFDCYRCGASGKLRGDQFDTESIGIARNEGEFYLGPPEGYMPLAEEPACSAESMAEARAYARKRKLTNALCRELDVGGVLEGYYSGRIIVPVCDEEGNWRGWVGRDWTGLSQRPYQYPRGMPRAERMFNHAALRVASDTPVLVVEGVLDCIPHWPNACALMGKPIETHIQAMIESPRPVVIVLDGDAHEEAWALAMRLRFEGRRAGYVRLPPKVDPDEVSRDWLADQALRSLDAVL